MGANHKGGDAILLFGQNFPKTCMKIKEEEGPKDGRAQATTSPTPRMASLGVDLLARQNNFPERCHLVVVSRSLTTTNMAVTWPDSFFLVFLAE